MNITNLRLLSAAAAATLALSGCATPGYSPTGYGNAPQPTGSNASCYDCGTVTRIEMTGGSSAPNATGAVLGGLVGAAAGRAIANNQTDSQGRQNTATVAGAVAGAVAGNAIQNRNQQNGGNYNVHVRMNDGRTTVVSQTDLGGIREGSYVRVYNGRAWIR